MNQKNSKQNISNNVKYVLQDINYNEQFNVIYRSRIELLKNNIEKQYDKFQTNRKDVIYDDFIEVKNSYLYNYEYEYDKNNIMLEDLTGRIKLSFNKLGEVEDKYFSGQVLCCFGVLSNDNVFEIYKILEHKLPLRNIENKHNEEINILFLGGLSSDINNMSMIEIKNNIIQYICVNNNIYITNTIIISGLIDYAINDYSQDIIENKLNSYASFDQWLSLVAENTNLHILPGPHDLVPSTTPLMPIPHQFIPITSKYKSVYRVTKPMLCTINNNIKILCVNEDEILKMYKLNKFNNILDLLELILLHRHIAPIIPEMCPTHPFSSTDPFVLLDDDIPHLLICYCNDIGDSIQTKKLYNGSIICAIPSVCIHKIAAVYRYIKNEFYTVSFA